MTAQTLPIPEEIPAAGGDNVLELARLWWNDEQAAMVIRPALTNPELLGAVLAELAWNFSRAYAGSHGMDQAGSLKKIIKGWDEAHARTAGLKPAPLMPSALIDKSKEA